MEASFVVPPRAATAGLVPALGQGQLVSGARVAALPAAAVPSQSEWFGGWLKAPLVLAAAAVGSAAQRRQRRGRRNTLKAAADKGAAPAPWAATAAPQKGLRLFLDTADREAWAKFLPLGIFHGVTSNPVILQRCGVPCDLPHLKDLLSDVLQYKSIREVFMQAWGEDPQQLVAVARSLRDLDPSRVVVKLPLTEAGIAAAAILRPGVDTRVCMTICYSAQQGLIASALGAQYIAPYLGRMNARGLDGIEECVKLQQAMTSHHSNTRVQVASIRDPDQMTKLAARGVDTFTFSPAVAAQLLDVEPTRQMAQEFQRAVAAGPQKKP